VTEGRRIAGGRAELSIPQEKVPISVSESLRIVGI
jgi:hypothetical protein